MHGGPRAQVVERLRARLLEGWPRLTMAAFVAVTGATGVLASVGLRALGVSHLAARYALAVLLAYAVLVLQLRVWVLLERRARRRAGRRGHAADAADVLEALADAGQAAAPPPGPWLGGGGTFQGGGAGGGWAEGGGASGESARAAVGAGRGGGLDLDFDLDGWAALALAALAVLAATALAVAGWLVWTAPTLLAEVFLDGAVSAGLYRRLRLGAEPRNAWAGAVRATWFPALLVLAAFVVAGLLAGAIAPEAASIGPAVEALLQRIR